MANERNFGDHLGPGIQLYIFKKKNESTKDHSNPIWFHLNQLGRRYLCDLKKNQNKSSNIICIFGISRLTQTTNFTQKNPRNI
jgi:hypothetical protein